MKPTRAAALTFAGPPALGAVVVVAACAALEGPAPVPWPENRCPAFECAAYSTGDALLSCQGGICVSPGPLEYTLVVDVPESASVGAGLSFPLASADFFTRETDACPKPRCIQLPRLREVRGVYIVRKSAADLVGVVLSPTGEDVSLPVRSRLIPAWRGAPTASLEAASAVGLPLLPVGMVNEQRPRGDFIGGPFGTEGIDFRAGVPEGSYELYAAPTPPFDTEFPPLVTPAQALGTVLVEYVAAADLERFRFPVSRVGGDLDGWTARFVDEASGRTLSSVVRLTARSTDVVLSVLRPRGTAAQPKLDLLLEPPPELGTFPTLVYKFVASTTPPIVYPALQPAVRVEGTVQGTTADGATVDVPASLLFDTSRVELADGPAPPQNLTLRYRRRIETDERGRYQVSLPPGTYQVAVTPWRSAQTGGFAKNPAQEFKVGAQDGAQAGRTLPVLTPTHVRGRVRLADGRPLSYAAVEATRAATLRAGAAGAEVEDGDASPRPSATTTAVDGAFDLLVDTGTFDITVKPKEGSRFPWVVLTSRTVGTSDVDLGVLEVPVPIVETHELRDALENPVRGALVRAYAPPPGSTVAVPIGAARTDENGRFVLDLAGLPRPPSP